jgi:hypothetical protein
MSDDEDLDFPALFSDLNLTENKDSQILSFPQLNESDFQIPLNSSISDMSTTPPNNGTQGNAAPIPPAYKYTPTIMMLVSPIPTFSGETNKLQDFLDSANTANLECIPEYRKTLFAQIVQKLTGPARSNLKSHPNVTTWETLKEHLVSQYRPQKDYNTLLTELQMVSQKCDETVLAYSKRIQRIVYRTKEAGRLEGTLTDATIEEMVKYAALNRFVNASHEHVALVLQCKEPKTLNDAIAAALKVENNMSHTQFSKSSPKYCRNCKTSTHNTENCRRSNSSPSFNSSKNCRYCHNYGHSIEECRKKKYNDTHTNKPNSSIATISSPSNQSKICHYCKKPGHIINECRKLKWKKEQEKKNEKSDAKPNSKANERSSSPPSFAKVNVVQTPEVSSANISTIGQPTDMIVQLESPYAKNQILHFL